VPYGASLGLEATRDATNRGNKGWWNMPIQDNNQLQWICAPAGQDLCCLWWLERQLSHLFTHIFANIIIFTTTSINRSSYRRIPSTLI
jgi:hypothetical protein